MDKKFILNSKMNANILMTDFWLWFGKLSSKATGFAIVQAGKRVKSNIEIVDEMMKLDYPNEFKTQLEELNGKGSK